MIKLDNEWLLDPINRIYRGSGVIPLHHTPCLSKDERGWTSDFIKCDTCRTYLPKETLRLAAYLTNKLKNGAVCRVLDEETK